MNKELYQSYNILKKVLLKNANTSIELEKLKENTVDQLNIGLVTKIVYGVQEKNLLLEKQISKYISKVPEEGVYIILKIGTFVKTELNSIPDFALVFELVEIVKKYESKFVAGFVNATLKKIILDENKSKPKA